ncbi:MAG: DUF4476 domain-containing protein [Archangium sp.]|nr:DUF4476 domain-containing protein [Archangium sp.]
MKTRLRLLALLTFTSTAALAQDVDLDVDPVTTEVEVPGMKVRMRVQQPMEEAPPPRQRAPKPPPVQVMGVDTFDIRFEMKPQETLRLLSPEGAHAEIWGDDGSYLGGFDLPCEVPARAGLFYRVVMTANGGLIFDRKVELRNYFATNVTMRGVTTAVVTSQPSRRGGGMVDFPALVEAVKAESFGEAKLDVVRTSEGGLTVDQVGQLVDLFSFSAEQVKVVELTHARLVDRQNAFKLYSHFAFDADKKAVKAILGK